MTDLNRNAYLHCRSCAGDGFRGGWKCSYCGGDGCARCDCGELAVVRFAGCEWCAECASSAFADTDFDRQHKGNGKGRE